jgi:hypothetical protein
LGDTFESHEARRQSHWRLKLLRSLPSVTEVCWDVGEPWKAEGKLGELLSCCYIHHYLSLNIFRTNSQKKVVEKRLELGNEVSTWGSISSNLTDLTLMYRPYNPRVGIDAESLPFTTGDSPDPLNTALRNLSLQLRRFRLGPEFVLSPDLFWPRDEANNNSNSSHTNELQWPHMEEFTVTAFSKTTDGESLARTSWAQPYGSSGATTLELCPEGGFDPVAVSITRAMLRMPKLKSMHLNTSTWDWGETMGRLFRYDKSGWARRTTTRRSYDLFGPISDEYQGPGKWAVPKEAQENWLKLRRRVEEEMETTTSTMAWTKRAP